MATTLQGHAWFFNGELTGLLAFGRSGWLQMRADPMDHKPQYYTDYSGRNRHVSQGPARARGARVHWAEVNFGL